MRVPGKSRRWARFVATLTAVAVTALVGPPAAGAAPQQLSVTLSGSNGVGTLTVPGLSCQEGGTGSYRHHLLEGPLPSGAFSQLAGTLRANVEVHRDGPPPPALAPTFLLGSESHLTLANSRGTLRLTLDGGDCTGDGPNAASFSDATHFTASGSLSGAVGTGAYRQATVAGGSYQLAAEVAPGADNEWSIGVSGAVDVLQPALQVTVDKTYWGNLGTDYAARIVSVRYRVANAGPGDAFAATLTAASSSTAGVTPLGPVPQPLGDLAAGDSEVVTVRYKLGTASPCGLVVLSCNFATTVAVTLPDALDVVATPTAAVSVHAPSLPPPL